MRGSNRQRYNSLMRPAQADFLAPRPPTTLQQFDETSTSRFSSTSATLQQFDETCKLLTAKDWEMANIYHVTSLSPWKCWGNSQENEPLDAQCITAFSEGGGLVCESVGKADLMSDHFDSKPSREADDLPLTCHRSQSHTTFAFRSSEVRRLLLDLDPYGGTDPFGMFLFFLREQLILWPPS